MKSQLYPPISDNDFVMGNTNARVTLLEYGDYECPHCLAIHSTIKLLQSAFGAELRFAFRDFPLSNIHPQAVFMATCARAAGRQHRFWEMHDIIFENQAVFNKHSLPNLIKQLDIDKALFIADIADPELATRINQDFESGIRSGVTGTPSFFVNGIKYHGVISYQGLYSAIALAA